MKILLTHGYFIREDEVEQRIMKPYPPLGLLYISGYLQSKGVTHEVFDSTFSSREELVHFLRKYKPDAVGIYANFLTRPSIVEIASIIRNSSDLAEMKIILGGPDVRFNQQEYLDAGIDFLVLGEGEQTFFELVQALQNGTGIAKVEGLVFKNKNQMIIRTGERLHLRNLDALPQPNREKIDLQKYLNAWKHKHGYNSITVNTQRGCPYTCRWCSHAVFGDTYRRRTPGSVVDELVDLKEKYNPDSFWFVDDVFSMSTKWIREFENELAARQLKISYECISRADRLSEDVLQALKNTGCRLLWIGAESGSQKVIDRMDRRADVLKVREMIKMANKMGLETGTFIMLGYPGETVDDIRETIRHLLDCRPGSFTVNLAYPIKGTRLYEEVANDIVNEPGWPRPIDRDLDFKRTYSRKFYDFAIRKVYNEVYYQRNAEDRKYGKALFNKVKAVMATAAMYLTK